MSNRYTPRCKCAGCCGPYRIPPNNPNNVRFKMAIAATDYNTGVISVITGQFILARYSWLNGTHDLPFSGVLVDSGFPGDSYVWAITERDQSDPSIIRKSFSVRCYATPIQPAAFVPPQISGVTKWPSGPVEAEPDSPIVAQISADGSPTQSSDDIKIEFYVSENCTRYHRFAAPPTQLPYYARPDGTPPGIDVTRVVVRNAVNADA